MATAGAGHITNYAQNENGDVWDLQQLARHMGRSAWQVCVLSVSPSSTMLWMGTARVHLHSLYVLHTSSWQ